MLNRRAFASVVALLLVAAPLSLAACSSSSSSSIEPPSPATPSAGGDDGGITGESDASAGADAIVASSSPPPVGCPSAEFKTLVIVGDSISDVGSRIGISTQQPFYRTLLVENDDAKYPEWKGFDLKTCWGFDPNANVVKVSVGGAVATVPASNDGSNMGILVNQAKSLPAALPGPVLVVGTIGGNDVQAGLAAVLMGTKEQAQAKMDAFISGVGAALNELAKPDRFGAGVKAQVLLTDIYDPSGGTGHFYYGPAAETCGGALGYWPDNKETRTMLEPWNQGMAVEVSKHSNVKLLALASLFESHAVATPASINWFYKDCIHPNAAGHHAVRSLFWQGMRSLP